jgi:hypothetical protein
MSRTAERMPARGGRRASGALVVCLTILTVLGAVAPAVAYWSAGGSGAAVAATATLAAPTDVTVPATASTEVQVSWTAGVGGVTPLGYSVTRTDGDTTGPACSSSPGSPIQGLACTDPAVPDGDYTYVVTATYGSWASPSAPSGPVTVADAAQLAFEGQPSDVVATATMAPTVRVALRTADGSPFPSAGAPVTVSLGAHPAGAHLTGTTTVDTDADGIATFDALSIDILGAGYTLVAASPGLASATSTPFTVRAPSLLDAAADYSVLAGTAVVSTGATSVSGDLGVSPGASITGFGPGFGTVGGDIHAGDADAAAAQSAFVVAYDGLAARPADAEVGDLGGLTLPPGTFHSTAALALTGTLTLDAHGDPDAMFVFQTDAAFNTAAASRVLLVGGAVPANVFWVVAGAAGTGADSFLSGTVLAHGAITLGASTELLGRALSRDAVTLAGNVIRFTAALPPSMTIDGGATAVTQDTTPTVSGTSSAAASSPVVVTIGGQSLFTAVGADGTWSVTAAALIAGRYEVVAKVRDASGNGTVASQVLTVEVNPATVSLGTAGTYSVLAGTGVVNTGASRLSGDLGVDPSASTTGFPPGTLAGAIHADDAAAAAAQVDLLAALDDASSRAPHTEIVGDLGGRTFHVGVHHSTGALGLTGTVTLDGEGDPNAVFIFQTDAAFDTAAASRVELINGARSSNVFWVVAGAAGTGADSILAGSILARGAITLGAATALTGQALSRDAVTLAGAVMTGVAPAPVADGPETSP